MHEIITIQLGQTANFLGTHFWNIQESYQTFAPAPPSPVDHDIHFRPGIGADGVETYLPRTVIYDLKGGFGSLKRINELYEMEGGDQGSVWNGPTKVQTEPTIPPSAYIESLSSGLTPTRPTKETVKYFSDFSHTYYHPRSIVQLNDYTLASKLHPFNTYGSGDDLFNALDKEHDLLDRDLRLWAEECDQMQGLQIFTSSDDAWAGFASRYVERLRDEYGKVGVWVWGVSGGQNDDSSRALQVARLQNSAQALYDISTQASMYIPISGQLTHVPKYLKFDPRCLWHTSAVLSTALESVMLPSRLHETRTRSAERFGDLEQALNVNGNQRIALASFSVSSPEPKKRNDRNVSEAANDARMGNGVAMEVEDELRDQSSLKLDIDLFPEWGSTTGKRQKSGSDHTFGNVLSRRGEDADDNADRHSSFEGHDSKRRRLIGSPQSARYDCNLSFPLLDSFPDVYSLDDAEEAGRYAVESQLTTTSAISTRVKNLQAVVKRMVGFEDREILANGLGEIAEAYTEGWESSSGDSDDD